MSGSNLPSTFIYRLPQHTQIRSWHMKIYDGKSVAYTHAFSGAEAPLDYGNGRLHTVPVRLTPSSYTDRSYFDRGSSETRIGYRAAFPSYSMVPILTASALSSSSLSVSSSDFPSTAREDTIRFQFTVTDFEVKSDRTPRFGIVQLMGLLFGLAVGTLCLGKIIHEILDAVFNCTVADRRIALSSDCWRLARPEITGEFVIDEKDLAFADPSMNKFNNRGTNGFIPGLDSTASDDAARAGYGKSPFTRGMVDMSDDTGSGMGGLRSAPANVHDPRFVAQPVSVRQTTKGGILGRAIPALELGGAAAGSTGGGGGGAVTSPLVTSRLKAAAQSAKKATKRVFRSSGSG
jgi:hypothetical protein